MTAKSHNYNFNGTTHEWVPLSSTNALNVADSTVSGLLTTMDVDTGLLSGCVSGTEMQVDVVGSLPTGSNSIGQVTCNAGTNLDTSGLATESGGNLATLASCVAGTEMQVDIVSMPANTPAANSNTTQNLSISTVTSSDSTALETTSYNHFSVIVFSDVADQQVQVQWSQDGTNYYQTSAYLGTIVVNDETNANPQNILAIDGVVLAKWMKVAVYNPSGGTASVDVLVNLIA
jgi:hypothetical protein